MKKIFGIGMSRTGTTSLAAVLKQAGINLIHYPTKAELFNPKNDGACDIPAAIHYKELDKRFPNSKFIYTFREKEEWLTSMEKYLKRKRTVNLASYQHENRMGMYGQIEFNKDAFAAVYNKHDNDIREYFKNREKDLLILNICGGDEIGGLLSFIGKPNKNPSQKFPQMNKVK